MTAVNDFFFDLEENQKEIGLILHHLLESTPGISTKIRYRIPFYYRKSWICYLNPIKKGGIELAFTRANELSNYSGLLDFKNRKQVGGITITDPRDIPMDAIEEVLREAMLLDEHIKYASKRKQ